LRDADKPPDNTEAETYSAAGGIVITWRDGRALEEELFWSLSEAAIKKLIEIAVENVGEDRVDSNIKSSSDNAFNLAKCVSAVTCDSRAVLGKAAKANSKTKKTGWFKSITAMEPVGREIVGPDLKSSEAGFREIVERIFAWVADVGK
jgi:hypothetical protein